MNPTPVMSIFLPIARFLISSIWIFHGLYSKLLGGIPRHEAIVGRILGERFAHPGTMVIGVLEICLGVWAFTGWRKVYCAAVQTAAIFAMNILEILIARDLLLSAAGMVAFNAAFLLIVWWWALSATTPAAPFRTP
ncbi:MAG: hypothetical protein EOP87_03795 [Verrucomicrobiaceae bacterium]|nr:MAG: hypothetical protein EOP87_03795 [Verrucomicrobiaceae bacterium]